MSGVDPDPHKPLVGTIKHGCASLAHHDKGYKVNASLEASEYNRQSRHPVWLAILGMCKDAMMCRLEHFASQIVESGNTSTPNRTARRPKSGLKLHVKDTMDPTLQCEEKTKIKNIDWRQMCLLLQPASAGGWPLAAMGAWSENFVTNSRYDALDMSYTASLVMFSLAIKQ